MNRWKEYAAHHQTLGNKISHFLGIPLVLTAVFGLSSHFPDLPYPLTKIISGPQGLFRLDYGFILWGLLSLMYFKLDWRIAGPLNLSTFGFYLMGRTLTPPILFLLFILGWVFQFLGHFVFEKKSPAFLKNLNHLWLGPFWIYTVAIGYEAAKSKEPPPSLLQK